MVNRGIIVLDTHSLLNILQTIFWCHSVKASQCQCFHILHFERAVPLPHVPFDLTLASFDGVQVAMVRR